MPNMATRVGHREICLALLLHPLIASTRVHRRRSLATHTVKIVGRALRPLIIVVLLAEISGCSAMKTVAVSGGQEEAPTEMTGVPHVSALSTTRDTLTPTSLVTNVASADTKQMLVRKVHPLLLKSSVSDVANRVTGQTCAVLKIADPILTKTWYFQLK